MDKQRIRWPRIDTLVILVSLLVICVGIWMRPISDSRKARECILG